jgi:ABC-type cobalamin/Fe3+-siderophores transport system ATPase subunit
MSTIERVDIQGFWGQKNVSIVFDRNVNFLIGRNGCGKTTFINILASVLKLDIDEIARSPFSSVKITFNDAERRRKPSILVEKTFSSSALIEGLRYTIQQHSRAEPEIFDLADIFDLRRYRTAKSRRTVPLLDGSAVEAAIGSLIRLTWLSIHRGTLGRRFEDSEGAESTVDKKVREITSSFGSFFSLLDSAAARETRSFQEYIFLSLLHNRNESENLLNLTGLDMQATRTSLSQIFQSLGLERHRFAGKINSHFEYAASAIKAWNGSSSLTSDQFKVLMDTKRIQKVVREWQAVQTRIRDIYSPKDNFLSMLGSLFENKKVIVDERNQPVVIVGSSSQHTTDILSSGEKQLFILLGEALLQERQPHLFIADEPELSLHVEWQSRIVSNLLELNPSMQIIFATHSPDVVSRYQDRVIRMEEKVR